MMNTIDKNTRFYELAKKANVPTKLAEIFIRDNISDEEAVEFLSKIRSVKEKGINDSDKKHFLYCGILGKKNQILNLLENNKYFSDIYYDLNGDEIWELIKYWMAK